MILFLHHAFTHASWFHVYRDASLYQQVYSMHFAKHIVLLHFVILSFVEKRRHAVKKVLKMKTICDIYKVAYDVYIQ